MEFYEERADIVHVSNALRKYYGLDLCHESDPQVFKWLDQNQFRCVVLVLIDGMGTSVLERYQPDHSFVKDYLVRGMRTVFPPTTTAATTSLLTGKFPVETGWLGWNQYFSEVDDQVVLFQNRSQYNNKIYPDHFSREILPVHYLHEELREKGISADSVWPAFGDSHPCGSIEEMMEETLACVKEGNRFLYVYWDALDTYMHGHGPSGRYVNDEIKRIDMALEWLSERIPDDTGMIITADHSQIDVRHKRLEEYPDICECLRLAPSIETRSVSLFVKPERKEQFVKVFNEHFKDDFHLFTHEDVFEKQLFGKGKMHPRVSSFIGDYLGVAVSDVQLDYGKVSEMKGNHAGAVKEEFGIPLILFSNKMKG